MRRRPRLSLPRDLLAACILGGCWFGAVVWLRPTLAALPRQQVAWATVDLEDHRPEAQYVWCPWTTSTCSGE